MAAKRRSLVKLMFYYATGIFWSCFIFLRMLWVLIKEGPRAVFKSSERHHRPNVMNDESLGTHKTIKLSVSVQFSVCGLPQVVRIMCCD